MINAKQLRENVVRPALQDIGLWSQSAENLIMGTAAQESRLGEYIVQLGNGPAKGIFQMEPNTLRDIQENYLKYKPELKDKVDGYKAPSLSDEDNLTCNLAYAAIMCRIHYLRVREGLPVDLHGMAKYWKKYYNTHLGKGTEAEFIENYHRFLGA